MSSLVQCALRVQRSSLLCSKQVQIHTNDRCYGKRCFMAACTFGRLDNVKMWSSRFQNWNVNRRNTQFGAQHLSCSVYLGPRKLKTLSNILIEEANANVHITRTQSGNIDLDSCLLKRRLLIQKSSNIFSRMESMSISKIIIDFFKVETHSCEQCIETCCERLKMTRSRLIEKTCCGRVVA